MDGHREAILEGDLEGAEQILGLDRHEEDRIQDPGRVQEDRMMGLEEVGLILEGDLQEGDLMIDLLGGDRILGDDSKGAIEIRDLGMVFVEADEMFGADVERNIYNLE